MADPAMHNEARLRALHEQWEELKNFGDATSRDKKRALAGTFINALPGLLDELDRLRAESVELRGAIERDRTAMADITQEIRTRLDSHFWLTEGRGSYEWDDDRYRDEFHQAARGLLDAIKPIEKLAADLTNSPRDKEAVIQARRDMEAEIDRLRAALEQIADGLARHKVTYTAGLLEDVEKMAREAGIVTITEEHLECCYCDWIGLESDANQKYRAEDDDEDILYLCPLCAEECAHFPLDEVGKVV